MSTTSTTMKKFLGGVAAAIALSFVAAPSAHAAKPSADSSQVQGGGKTAKKDSGWG